MTDGQSSILPFLLPYARDSEEIDVVSYGSDRCEQEQNRQAGALMQPYSCAATKTASKMLHNPNLARHMLARGQHPTHDLDDKKKSSKQTKDFMIACQKLFTTLEQVNGKSGSIKVYNLKDLFQTLGMEINDVQFRQWEHSLPVDTTTVSITMFIQACRSWFGEKPFLEQVQRLHLDAGMPHEGHSMSKSVSAPQLTHPYRQLAQESEDTKAFDYEAYANRLHQEAMKRTHHETLARRGEGMVRSSKQLRRKTKVLQSMPTLPTTPEDRLNCKPLHDRLHDEILSHNILSHCAKQTLATNLNRINGSEQASAVSRARKAQMVRSEKRRQDTATANAFAASIGMIARHLQHEELQESRAQKQEVQNAVVNRNKYSKLEHKVHYRARAREIKSQQLREVQVMKELAREEAMLVSSHLAQKQALFAASKTRFEMTASSSTIYPPPPELLAARATAKTSEDLKEVALMEKDHLERVRSLQQLDYSFDRRLAILEANRPRTEAGLVDVDISELPDDRLEKLQDEELWRQYLEMQIEQGRLESLPSRGNIPPAALRYYGEIRPVPTPAFNSSVQRSSS